MALQILSGAVSDASTTDSGYIEVEYDDPSTGAETIEVFIPSVMAKRPWEGALVTFMRDSEYNPNTGVFISFDDFGPVFIDELPTPTLQEHTHKLFSQPTLNKMLPNITDPKMKQDMVNQTTGEVLK